MVYLLIHYLNNHPYDLKTNKSDKNTNNHPYDNKQIRQEYKQSSLWQQTNQTRIQTIIPMT